MPLLCVMLLAEAVFCTGGHAVFADGPRRGTLTLNDGATLRGHVVPGESSSSIGWQGVDFVDPFEFRSGTIRTIKYESVDDAEFRNSPFSFELTTGDIILGRLAAFTTETVEIEVESVGLVAVRAELLRRIQRIDENAAVTFSSLRGMQGWSNADPEVGVWIADGDQIWTDSPGAIVSADPELPSRAVIDFELSWINAPDFVFAIGVDSDEETDGDGWRLETAGDTLAIVHEMGDRADVESVADLSKLGRIRLIVYVDQDLGTMQVLKSDGTSIGSITLPVISGASQDDASAESKSGIRIVNRGQSLRLERLQIAKWVGGIPSGDLRAQASIALADGSVLSARIERFDSNSNRLQLVDSAGGSSVDLGEVASIRFAPLVSNADPGQCAMFLRGGMRISGTLLGVDDSGWRLGGDHYQKEIPLPHQEVRTVVFFESEAADTEFKPVLGRIGRLEVDGGWSSGRLVDNGTASEEDPESIPLRWHPLTSNTSARLNRDVSGKIVYRDPPKFEGQSAAAQMLAQQRLRNQQQRRGLNFGELFLQRADLTKNSPVKRDNHTVHFRSGDVVACRVDAIDENGVVISTANSDGRPIPHQLIKAIEFVSNSPPPNIDEAKRERLLTIPRLQKKLPPTHLLCSHNGDFLRCRVLETQNDVLRVEVQLEEFLIPRNRIAQIIWFHDDELDEVDGAATSGATRRDLRESAGQYIGMVQVVMNDGKRVTFAPTGVEQSEVMGSSQWVGQCRFDLASVDQLLLGDQIPIEVADIAYNRWKLQPAVEPLVTEAMGGGDEKSAGQRSSLIGTDAPGVRLPLLSGEAFDLSKSQGQTVVLVFWASWSAPSMQALPRISEAVGGFDPSLVRLIAINLQEPSDAVQAALQRLQLAVDVALDNDGAVAQRYQTSLLPQIVVVGPDGKVHGLYVGGEKELVDKMLDDLRQPQPLN